MIKLHLVNLGRLVSAAFDREEGQTLAEYALILALIALGVIVAVLALQGSITGLFNSVSSQV